MKKEQYVNKFRDQSLSQQELDRKWRVHKELEMFEAFSPKSMSSVNVGLVTGGGAGNGGAGQAYTDLPFQVRTYANNGNPVGDNTMCLFHGTGPGDGFFVWSDATDNYGFVKTDEQFTSEDLAAIRTYINDNNFPPSFFYGHSFAPINGGELIYVPGQHPDRIVYVAIVPIGGASSVSVAFGWD